MDMMLNKKAVMLAALLLMSCGTSNNTSGTNNKPDESNDPNLALRRQILSDIGQHAVVASQSAFTEKASALETATAAWAAAPTDTAARDTARDAWQQATAAWQVVEVMQIGPAGLMEHTAGGEGVRDEIYSWPLNNRCRVEVELVNQGYTDAAAFTTSLINTRGLDALEVLLFTTGAENACSTQHPINADGTWAALSEDEINARRASYAAVAAKLTREQAERLETMWSPQGQDFLKTLTSAGQGSARYATTQEALNAISDAMFYLEKETKDMKLGEPIGLINCEGVQCPADATKLEFQIAPASKASVLANLRGFELIYHGGDPATTPDAKGFDDLVRALGQGALADAVEADLKAAREAIEAIPGDLQEALVNDPEAVITAFEKLKAMLDRVKTEFISVLDLELPQRAEGDND